MNQGIDPLDPLNSVYEFINTLSLHNYATWNTFAVAILLGWVAVEIIFWIMIDWYLLPSLQPLSKPLPQPIDPLQTMMRVMNNLEAMSTYTFEKYVHGFFRGAKVSELSSGNLRSFFSFMMYTSKESDLCTNRKRIVDVAYENVCKRFNLDLPIGHNYSVRHVDMTIEKIPYIHRPLLLYVMSGILDLIGTTLVFRCRGYQHLEIAGLTYWFRDSGRSSLSPSDQNNLDPIIFFHGITPGWLAYMLFASKLSKGRPIFLVNFDSIKIKSMKFSMPSPESFSHSVKEMLTRHKFTSASLVGHSFGTVTSAWFLQKHPECVSHLTFVDPVSLLLGLPDVAYNFLYKPPRSFVEWMIHFFAANELTISHMLHRNFWWYRNIFWLEDVPSHIGVVVGVSGGDEVGNPAALCEYVHSCHMQRLERQHQQLQQQIQDDDNELHGGSAFLSPGHDQQPHKIVANIETVFWPGYSHGQMLLNISAQDDILNAMRRNEKAAKNLIYV